MSAPVPSLASLVSLSGRVAVVTGASQGIGEAVALRLAEAGASLALIGRDAGTLKRVQDRQPAGTWVLPLSVDLRDPEALRRGFCQVIETFGQLDIWINNAGVAPRRPVLEITLDDWEDVMSLNVRAALLGAQLAAAHMVAAGRPGVIVNMLSSTIHRVSANPAHYRASKLALLGLTQNLAVELGRYGIRVLGVAAGLTETPMVAGLRAQGPQQEQGLAEFVRRLPLRRIASADEIARVTLFAVSDLASFMTGNVLDVDGGESQK